MTTIRSTSRARRLGTALGAALLAGAACGGPLGPIPGGRLTGEEASFGPDALATIDAAHTVQLETRPGDPYSVNVWCGVVDGRIYVPTSLILGTDDPEERTWVLHARADPRVRMRVDGRLYDFTAVRVSDATEREQARTALLAKYSVEADEHATQAWIFRLEPRS